MSQQALDVALEAIERLDLGVQLGFGGGQKLQLNIDVLLALVQLAATRAEALQDAQLGGRQTRLARKVGR